MMVEQLGLAIIPCVWLPRSVYFRHNKGDIRIQAGALVLSITSAPARTASSAQRWLTLPLRERQYLFLETHLPPQPPPHSPAPHLNLAAR